MDRKRQKLSPEKIDVKKECQDAKITDLERKLVHLENKLKLVTAELEQVKEERVRDKINFETENCQLKSEMDKYKEQCTELQSENDRLQKYLQDLESAKINVEEKSQMNFYSTDLTQQITKVNESNDEALDINSLRDEIILEVFGHLNQNQLGQIARVCRRWSVLAKSPVLWKKVNVKFLPSHRCQTTVAESFINGLPSCVTYIRLDFTECENWIGFFCYAKLCVILKEKCPDIEVLILDHSVLSDTLPTVIDINCQLFQDVKNLVFHDCKFPLRYSATGKLDGTSKIEVLDLSGCSLSLFNKPQFSRMPYLKVLSLYNITGTTFDSWFLDDTFFLDQLHVLNMGYTHVTDSTFQAIRNHGHNLKELYICGVDLQDHDLNFNDSEFPHLKTICLYDTLVTYEGVVSLLQSCPSLQNVYVNEDKADSFEAHSSVVANRCKSEIVKATSWFHFHNVEFL